MTVEGLHELEANIKELRSNLGESLANALLQGGRVVQSATIKSIQKPQGAGKAVIRYHSGQAPYKHMASVEGQAPNTDTGELVRGIQLEVKEGSVFVGVESSQDLKAMALEFGKTDGTLKPRPFLFPAFERSKDRIRQLISSAVAKEVQKNG